MSDCQLWSVSQGHLTADDLATPILTSVHAGSSREELLKLGRRNVSGKRTKAANGEWQGGYVPYGYDVVCGAWTLRGLCNRLNERKVHPVYGDGWYVTKLGPMLRNPVYYIGQTGWGVNELHNLIWKSLYGEIPADHEIHHLTRPGLVKRLVAESFPWRVRTYSQCCHDPQGTARYLPKDYADRRVEQPPLVWRGRGRRLTKYSKTFFARPREQLWREAKQRWTAGKTGPEQRQDQPPPPSPPIPFPSHYRPSD